MGDYPEATASDDLRPAIRFFRRAALILQASSQNFRARVIRRPFIRNLVDAGKTQNFAFGTFELGLEG